MRPIQANRLRDLVRGDPPKIRLVSSLVALTLLTHLIGCASAPEIDATIDKTKVPAGINDRFLSDDLDVDAYVERFEGESRAVYAERVQIVKALRLEAGDSVADIGAGTGFFSFLFTDAVGDEGSVHAVEISPRFLDHLRAQKAERGATQLNVVEGTDRSVSLTTDSIDLAFICDVYHHFEHPQATLASLKSALRPGGSLVLIDFDRIPGKTPDWLLEHVRAGREVFQAEIESAGFRLVEDIDIPGLDDNYVLRFESVN